MEYSYSALSTDFELEPVLEQYLETYPGGEFQSYEIIFKTEIQDEGGGYAYILVCKLNPPPHGDTIGFLDFLTSYCKVNDKFAVAGALNSVIPTLKMAKTLRNSGMRVIGRLK